MNINILHLSDLHVSEKELPHVRRVMAGLFSDLDRMADRGIKPDLVFFTGDLINKGENSATEFKLVSSHIIEPLLERLRLTQDALIAIPGNHEIDRKKAVKELETGLEHTLTDNLAFEEYYRNHATSAGFAALKEKLLGYRLFSEAYKNQYRVADTFFYDAYRIPLNKCNIGIIGLNSAWRSSGFGSDDKRLIVGEAVIDEALATIANTDLKICLCHHPFEMLCEWDSKIIRRRVAKAFDFLFTGHVHDSDVAYTQQIFGGVIVCTSGCLNKDKFNFYSHVQAELSKSRVTVHLRKWYPDRQEFDQETEKAADGRITFDTFKCGNPETAELIEINELRSRLQAGRLHMQIINPLEGVVELTLRDVFVEPVISDTSTFERDQEEGKTIGLNELLSTNDNLLLYGRPEYGKTALLEYAYNALLNDDKHFDGKIPVFIKFSEVPKNNYEGLRHVIRRHLDDSISRDSVDKYLRQGRFVILIDDFNDRQDMSFQAKVTCLKKFFAEYPMCRYLLTLTEHLSQTFHYDALQWHDGFQVATYYINSFNTAKIRQLLIKINTTQELDVNAILEQILFYFQQLQMPVTPLAITLFVGVLFRDKGKKNIQNEAYLIENYLETILEKLYQEDKRSELDFREKESFLAHVAYRMVEKRSFEWSTNEFEKEKLAYFEGFEEDVPTVEVFDDFFVKGILQDIDHSISFKFKFWFYFFLAKGMEKDDRKKAYVLALPEYLNYATALAYKAGLSRNDGDLLASIDTRTVAAIEAAMGQDAPRRFAEAEVDQALSEISEKVQRELTERSQQEVVDTFRDQTLPSPDSPQKVEAVEDCDKIGQLLTLHSDIIRNTREIDAALKLKYLKNNVDCYVAMMWGTLQAFNLMLNVIDLEDLPKLLAKGLTSKKQEVRLKRMVEGSHRMVLQVVPLSIIFYMADRLGSPKLSRAVEKLLLSEVGDIEGVFYLTLLFKLEPTLGLKRMKAFLKGSYSAACDYLIFSYLRVFSYENEVPDHVLADIVEVLEMIRNKYPAPNRQIPPFLKDTFAPDFRKRVHLKRKRL